MKKLKILLMNSPGINLEEFDREYNKNYEIDVSGASIIVQEINKAPNAFITISPDSLGGMTPKC